jgi:cyclopropane fatty-acyl-phospholipid synthase-like methyltransferase
MDDDGFEKLALIGQGHCAFQLLHAGVEFGVFDYLSANPNSSEPTVASHFGLHLTPARVLLRGLASLELLIANDGSYRNSHVSDKYLTTASPHSMTAVVRWQAEIVYPGVADFVQSLRTNSNVGLRHFEGSGETIYTRLQNNSELQHIFQRGMDSLSRANNAGLLNATSLANVTHLLDVGGGTGTNALALVRKYPTLKVTIFDFPAVCKLADEVISTAGLSHDQVKTCGGTDLNEAFATGDGIDGILFAHLPNFSEGQNVELFRQAYQTLPSGGVAIVFQKLDIEGGTAPASCVLNSVYFMAIGTGEGVLFSADELKDQLKRAGFTIVEEHALERAHTVIIGKKL